MAKFICTNLNHLLMSNTYTTPKGNRYEFQLGNVTDVPDPEDAEFFRKVDGFKEVGVVEKIKAVLPKPEKKLTKEDIYKMNRIEQVDLIRKLDPTAVVPGTERARVEMILKLLKDLEG